MEIFRYGAIELDYLKQRDQALARAIERIGMIERAVIPDLFTALIHSIVSQQVSNKAAATVWQRLLACFGPLTPEAIAALPADEIQRCGLSLRKANYIQGIAAAVVQGTLRLAEFPALSDEEIIRRLVALRGVGVWTAEMLLIFSMQRPDVVSWGDLAIRRGMLNLYGLEALDRAQFEHYRKRYSPYGSVASLYLWELAREPTRPTA